MTELKIICCIATFLYIVFDTDALLEYSKILRLKFVRYKEFEEFKKVMPTCEYNQFLLIKYPNFFTKLITCPICIVVWLACISSVVLEFPVIDLGILIMGSWIVYFILVKGLNWLFKG